MRCRTGAVQAVHAAVGKFVRSTVVDSLLFNNGVSTGDSLVARANGLLNKLRLRQLPARQQPDSSMIIRALSSAAK